MELHIVETVTAPIASVWGFISDFGAIERWHPEVDRCEAIGVGVGAERRVYFKDSWAQESLLALDANHHSLEYEVTDSSRPEVVGARTRMSLISLDSKSTQLEWESRLPGDDVGANALKVSLENYYRGRVGHLRSALGVA